MYFLANDGTGEALWRSDGTSAGTMKVNLGAAAAEFQTTDLPELAGAGWAGWNGNLFFLTVSPTNDLQWWVTNGTTTTLLKDFGPYLQPATASSGEAPESQSLAHGGGVALQFEDLSDPPLGGTDGDVWVTDGTPAGTRLQQSGYNGGTFVLSNLDEAVLPSGQFLQYSENRPGYASPNSGAAIYTSDGMGNGQLVMAFGPGSSLPGFPAFLQVGDEFYFVVNTPQPGPAEESPFLDTLWVTDGTTTDTHEVPLPTAGPVTNNIRIDLIAEVDGKLLLSTDSPYQPGAEQFWLTDGTSAGTTQVLPPAGATGPITLMGQFPPGTGAGAGDPVFRSGNQIWVIDATTGTSRPLDPTGLPTGFVAADLSFSPPPTAVSPGNPSVPFTGAVYFNGAVYFSAANGSQHAQLWQWTVPGSTSVVPPVVPPVAPPVVPPVVPPAAPPVVPPVSPPVAVVSAVLGVAINNGQAQRSMVTSITVTFDQVLDFADGAVSVVNTTTGTPIFLFLDPETVNGVTVLTITFGGTGVIGGSVPDGQYTLTIYGAKVMGTNGVTLTSNTVVSFTRLFGDLTGSGSYDPAARVMVQDALGQMEGEPGYIAALDWNGNGVIDEADVLAVVRNWGKSV